MKFEAMLELAHRISRGYVTGETKELALAVIDLLGEDQDCGMEAPDVFRFEDRTPGIQIGEDTMSSREARVFAAMILRAADQAEDLP